MSSNTCSRRLGIRKITTFLCSWLAIVSVAVTQAADWKVGVAKTTITPEFPIHLVGYGGRNDPFSSVEHDIYAKALAFEDARGYRGIIVTGDLVGFQDIFFGSVCERVIKKNGSIPCADDAKRIAQPHRTPGEPQARQA